MRLGNVRPSRPICNAADVAPVESEIIGNRLVRFACCGTSANLSNEIVVENGVVMLRAARHRGACNALSRTEHVPRVVATPPLNKALSAGWANLWRRRLSIAGVRTCRVHSNMDRVCQKLKILKAIVSTVAVPVVNVLGGQYRPANVLAHHQAMLKNVAALASVGMRRTPHEHVSILRALAVVPSRIFAAANLMAVDIAGVGIAFFDTPQGSSARRNELLPTTTFAQHDMPPNCLAV